MGKVIRRGLLPPDDPIFREPLGWFSSRSGAAVWANRAKERDTSAAPPASTPAAASGSVTAERRDQVDEKSDP